MRRRKLRWLVAGLAVLLAAGEFVVWPRPDRVTQENFDRIREGMNREEVYAILGPPGDFRTGPVENAWVRVYRKDVDHFGKPVEGPDYAMWESDHLYVFVRFRNPGCVVDDIASSFTYAGERIPQGHLENLIWRAKRQWRRWFPEK